MTTDCHVSISLDGFLAGPDQSLAAPLGVGGERVHAWHWPTKDPALANDVDDEAGADMLVPRGA